MMLKCDQVRVLQDFVLILLTVSLSKPYYFSYIELFEFASFERVIFFLFCQNIP